MSPAVWSGRRPSLFALCVAVFFCAAAVTAYGNALSTAGAPDYVRGLVPVRVYADSTVASVTVSCDRGGGITDDTESVQESPGVFVAWVQPQAQCTVRAVAHSAGADVWTSPTVTLRADSYAPKTPEAMPPHGALVRSPSAFTVRVWSASRHVTLQFKRDTKWVDAWTGDVTPDPEGKVTLPAVAVTKGAAVMRLISSNGFGTTTGPTKKVYNLGKTPNHTRYVLVDKSERRLYEIHSGVVTFTTRCAIGMPWAPTPTGTFKLGKRRRTPNAVWGPWRMPMLHKAKSGSYHATGYYLHGTNRPSSIGKMASHGCVRVQNSQIRVLSKRLKGYVFVIRN